MKKLLPRSYENLSKHIRAGRVLVIYGPRRVGKTTLVRQYLKESNLKTLHAIGDDIRVQNLLSEQNLENILEWASGYDAVFIDEAQRMPNVGWALKLLIDARPDLCIIATGSASFELAGRVGEPLTGRQVPLHLHPISIHELKTILNNHEVKENVPNYLVFGMYPEVLTAPNNKEREFILQELMSSYLFKDILELEKIKNRKTLSDLLVLIALQIGNEVSLNELAGKLSIDVKTVARYLDLFEKSFVLYNLRGFSRNLRKEVTRTSKYYFYDTGVRNAVIGNFNDVSSRNDVGVLWENFLVIERLKAREYKGITARDYFWRTWEQKEIDLIEDRGGKLHAYEFKWSTKKNALVPKAFSEAYPQAEFKLINPNNFLKFAS